MTTSFAAYASQFLNRQQQPEASVSSNSQPLFYSFTTDNGSQTGLDMSHAHGDMDLDDEEDPHLGRSSGIISRYNGSFPLPDDDDDPYLRLDEDDRPLSQTTRFNADSLPLIGSESRLEDSDSDEAPQAQGWLAHQAPMSYRVSPRPPSDSSSDIASPPADIFTTPARAVPTVTNPPASNTLTESLLPRDGVTRPVDVFSLPDPRVHSRGRILRKDAPWTLVWFGSVIACVVGSIIVLFTTSSRPKVSHPGAVLPYTTLLHSIPLITILIFISAAVSYAHIMLLRIFVRPVIIVTSIFIPATLFVSALWAFIGSFMWEEGTVPTWGETVGLRLFSLFILILAIFTSRRLRHLPEELHTTSSVLTLSTSLLIANPLLLGLSPVILLASLLGSIPFMTLAFRLLTIGYFANTTNTAWEWHVKNWAGWSIAGTVSVWLWSWAVARGVLRTTCAAVIGAWYFSPLETADPAPLDTHRLHAALFRSTDTSLGSIVLASLLLTGVRLATLSAALLRRAPIPLLPWLTLPINVLGNISGALSSLALVYTGLTGDAFFPGARRARALVAAVENAAGKVRYRRSGVDPSLAMLTITPLTLTLPFALTAYLFVAHTLGAPGYAPVAALLAGGVTALVGKFCVGLVEDTADTLYMCYCIDRDVGQSHRDEVQRAFEWQGPVQTQTSRRERPPSTMARPTRHRRSPSPNLSESSGDIDIIPLRESQRVPLSTMNSKVLSPPPREHDELQESHTTRVSEGSTMLGLDFV